MRYPLLLLSVSWVIGLFFCSFFLLSKLVILVIALISLFFLIGSIYLYYYKSTKGWLILFLFVMFMFGIVRMGWYQSEHQSVFSSELIEQFGYDQIGIRGYIDNKPSIDGDLVKFIIKPISYYDGKEYIIKTKEKVLIYLYLKDEKQLSIVDKWNAGMGIRLTGTFSNITMTNNPGQFNYIEYMERQGIFWRMVVNGIENVYVTKESPYNKLVNNLRANFTNILDILFNKSHAGFLKAILLGDTSDLSQDVKSKFSITGLSHLLAISGLHFSIIAFLLLSILVKLRVTRENAAVIVSIVLIFYMLLIGARPSVVRATIMTLLMFYGFIFKNRFSALQALGIALLLMTFYNPMWIFNIGFQLSFVITFYILWGYPEIYSRIPLKDGLVKKSLSLVIITQLASFPLIYYYFHQYSLISWLANLLIVPFFSSIILPFALFLLAFGSFKFNIIEFLAELMSLLLDVMFRFVDWSAGLSFLHFYGNINSFYVVISLYIIFSWLLVRKHWTFLLPFNIKKYILLMEKAVIVFLIIILILPYVTEKEVKVTFLDVGQGDSIYIETINGRNILIDSGGNITYHKKEWQLRDNPFDVGEDIVLPFLRYNGVNKLDLAILTHEDNDHIGGYFSIIENIRVETFIAEKDFPRTKQGEKLYNKLIEKNIKIVTIDNPKSIFLDNHTEFIFIPTGIDFSGKENDYSFAIILNAYDTKLLFSADIENSGEFSILESYLLPDIDILKVGHHGSNTSTSEKWLDILKPEEAIISVGENNRYNHPSEEVLYRLKGIGSNIWRTDYDGAIIVSIKSNGYYIKKTVNFNQTF